MPETLSAREFISGTQEALERLSHGAAMNLPIPPLKAPIYARDRTKDARMIAENIKAYFHSSLDGKKQLMALEIPHPKPTRQRPPCASPYTATSGSMRANRNPPGSR